MQRKPGGNPPLIALTPPLRPYKAFTLHRAFRFWAQTSERLHSTGRGNTQPLGTLSGQDSLTRALKMSCHLDLNFRWLGINPHHSLQVDTCGIRTHARDTIGLAARRLSRSANVSYAKSASQLLCSPGSHVTVTANLWFLWPPSPHHLTHSHTLMRTMCISRESNPGHIDGNDVFYH